MNAESFSRVEPFLTGLKHYCLKLTKNEWDAQDLIQESLTKVYHSLQQKSDRVLSKAYLQRIAKNAWTDHCRRKQVSLSGTAFDETLHQPDAAALNQMSIRETFEQLASRLNVRQMVLILLVDIFQFTAPEAAQLLHTTLGAVKEGLKRARYRLRTLADQSREGNEEVIQIFTRKRQLEAGNQVTAQSLSKEIFEQFLAGFRAGDAAAICRTYLLLADNGIHVEKVSAVGGRIYFTFRDPNGHLISFFQDV
jgi:RNA polymerase sigma factor (sigma-70 family)